jgi:hypothetical protein
MPAKKSLFMCIVSSPTFPCVFFSTVYVIARSVATKQSPVPKSLSYQNEVATPPKKQNGGSHSVPFG